MRRPTTLLAALALFIGASAAVPTTFDVQPPVWNKLATATVEEGINIRKTPSATAPRMIYDESKIEDFQTPLTWLGYWSTGRVGGNLHPVTFNGPQPVLQEENGWLKIKGIGPKETDAWVSAKYCTVDQPTPLTPANIASDAPVRIIGDTSDPDNLYAIYLMTNEMDGDVSFFVGKISNGMLICPYKFYCMNYTWDESRPTAITEDNGSYTFNCNPSDMEDYTPILSRFPASIFQKVLSMATPASADTVVLLINGSYQIFPK